MGFILAIFNIIGGHGSRYSAMGFKGGHGFHHRLVLTSLNYFEIHCEHGFHQQMVSKPLLAYDIYM